MEQFNGVKYIEKEKVFRAMIFFNGKHIHLMDSKSEETAEDSIDEFLNKNKNKRK